MSAIAASTLGADPSLAKLVRLYGAARAEQLAREILSEAGLRGLETPDDRYRFGGALVRRGGLLEMIGRAVRIQAILQGATEE